MPNYDPQNPQHRLELGVAVLTKLQMCGFVPETREGTKEKVYVRPVTGQPGMKVLVYTTIVGRSAREVGKDAIRVVAVYCPKEGGERGVGKADKRVHRTGDFEAIVTRMHQRMREVYKLAMEADKCPHCGAPLFKSRKGNMVCAELCWKH